MDNNEKHVTPLPLGIVCLLTYLVPFFGGIVFLLIEKRNRLIRFHAVQSILFWIFFSIYGVVINSVVRFSFLRALLQLAFLAAWVFMMYQAVREKMYELPLVGEIVKRQAFGEGWEKSGDKETPRREDGLSEQEDDGGDVSGEG